MCFEARTCIGYFICLSRAFHLLVPLRGHFLLFYSPHQNDAVRLLWSAVTPPLRPLCIPGVLETRMIHCLQRLFLRVYPSGIPPNLVAPPGPAMVCVGHAVFEDLSCRQPGVDWSIVLHPIWHEPPTLNGTNKSKLCRNQWVTIAQRICEPGVLFAHLWVERKCLILHSALLQHSCKRSLKLLSFTSASTCWPINHTLTYHRQWRN